MKMSKIFSLILVVVMLFSMTSCDSIMGMIQGLINPQPTHTHTPCEECGKCTAADCTGTDKCAGHQAANPLAGTYDITMWVSELPGVAEQFQAQIADFMAANPGIVINASIEGVTEADAASKVIGDIKTAPDMYCFAQDQLARLVQTAALAGPSDTVAARLREANDAGAVAAASVAGSMYAYPLTSDNGYYLYYDTSIIEDPSNLEDIIAACEANDLEFHYALENGWYVASFFFATGCHSNWTMDTNGNFTSVDDNFNSEAGLVAMKGMAKLARSDKYVSDADNFTNVGAIVTGIWKATEAQNHFGDNLGVAKLPSFTVDGETYQLGSFSGNKLLGVKPQADSKKALVLSLLAEYLTNEKCQAERYEAFQWGPSNKAVQASPAVQANPSLAALAAQNAYAIPQGQIHGSWWDIGATLGKDAKASATDADLAAALAAYEQKINALFEMTEEQKKAWSVIGNICGTSWDTDFPMTKVSENVYESEVLALNATEEFKCRQGASWTVNYGQGFDGANIVVETSGNYIVRLTITGDKTATIELIAQ